MTVRVYYQVAGKWKVIEISIKMTARNPFTTLTNLSFHRNCNRLDPSHPHPARRTSSPYFPTHKPSFMHDPYLSSYQTRLHQQQQYCQTLGIDTLRYPAPSPHEYYSLDNYKQQPLPETINDPTPPHKNTAVFTATTDMFSSDFFPKNKEEPEDILPKKTNILRKDTGGSSKLKSKKVQMDQDAFASKMQEQNESLEASEELRSKPTEVQIPATLYLKSKRKLFYLQKSCQPESTCDL